jgi:multiple sugar transport system substrate-binding protein
MGMYRRRTRLLSAITVTATLFGAAACGSGSSGGGSSSKSLSMWTFKQTHVKALEAAAAAFKKQTGITVHVTAYTPDDAYASKVQSAAATNDVADVLEVHSAGEDFVFGGAGILQDLSKSVDAKWKSRFLAGTGDSGLVTDTVYKSSQQPKSTWAGVQKGQLFSVPFTAGTFGIVYANKTKLKAAGLNPDKPPTTWSQFVSWLKTSTGKDPKAGGITLGLKVPSTAFEWLLQPLTYAYLGKDKYQGLFGKDKNTSWAGPDGEKALSLFNQLTPYWTSGSQTLSIDDADRAFAQGKSTFDVGGTFTMSSIAQDGLDAKNVVAFGIPPAEGGAVSDLKLAPVALTGLAVSAGSKNQDAATKWIDFLTSKERAGSFAKQSLDLPGTDLGADAPKDVGPDLVALEKVFGSDDDPNTYQPTDSTFKGPTLDASLTGNELVKMSPLKEYTPSQASKKIGTLVASSWK